MNDLQTLNLMRLMSVTMTNLTLRLMMVTTQITRTYNQVSCFLSASLYVSKRGAYWDRLCRDVVGRWLVGRWLSRACTVAKRCIL